MWIALSWQHYDIRFCGLWWYIAWSTMEVCHYRWRYITHWGLYIDPLYVICSIDGHSPQYGYIDIPLNAAACVCCFWSFRRFLIVHPGSHVSLLYLQHHGGVTGVCVLAVCHKETYCMKCLSISSIQVVSPQSKAFVYPWFGFVL